MKKLIERISGLVKGAAGGIRSLCLQRIDLSLMSVGEVMCFYRARTILNNDDTSGKLEQTKKGN